jgi:hypothetical protein
VKTFKTGSTFPITFFVSKFSTEHFAREREREKKNREIKTRRARYKKKKHVVHEFISLSIPRSFPGFSAV